MDTKQSQLIISLDFELFWGMFDKTSLKTYGENILGVRKAIPAILDLFTKYEIHATWATVGMLMFETRADLNRNLPQESLRPHYTDQRISSYYHIENGGVGEDEISDPYHFGYSLVKQILATPHQELGSHTFSHYYAEDGSKNSKTIFAADCQMISNAASQFNTKLTSIVFPRNQWTNDALEVIRLHGITTYRGNEDHFLYRSRKDSEQTYFIRGLRLLDHYLNISGHHTFVINPRINELPINIPASRFLRPYNHTLRFLEPLRLRRIKKSMTHAARHGEAFHLWWHPHNFGANLSENLKCLEEILSHSKKLNMSSCSMRDSCCVDI